MKTTVLKLDPRNIESISLSDWEEFFYAIENEVYEPFFALSEKKNKGINRVAKIQLNNDCLLNCDFCSLRKERHKETFFLQFQEIQSLLEKAQSQDIKEVILESGVLAKPQIEQLKTTLSRLNPLNMHPLYLDIGSETLLTDPELLEVHEGQNLGFFLDYSPVSPNFSSTLEIFNKREEIFSLLNSVSKAVPQKIYANFIVDLAGQEFRDILDDLFFLFQNPSIQGIKVCPFLPKEDTPFSIFGEACFLTTLKVLSITRLFKPEWEIFIDDSIEKLEYENTMQKALKIGANKEIFPFS